MSSATSSPGPRTRVRVAAAAAGAALVAVGLSCLPPTPGAAAAAPSVPAVPWTWGANSFGQLGTGTTQARPSPGPVTGLDDVVDLHGGREHVAALRADGTVWVWGSNVEGQLGLGDTANRTSPTRVPGIVDATAVETGHNLSLALLADGTVRTWGLNADGQLGDGTTTLRRAPVRVVGLGDATALAAGRNMSYALRADGTVVAWGRNDEGQLGDGTTVRRTTPVRVGTLTRIVGIAGGRDHGLALRDDGTVWAWGSNDFGQIGDGTLTDRTLPVQVASGVTQVIAGAHHSYALLSGGTVSAWGRNYRANLGDGTTTTRTRPVTVRNLSSVVSIGSGRDTGVAVLADGRVMAWGANESGQVGDGTTTNRSSAVLVPGIDDATLAGGGGQSYAVVLVAPEGPAPETDPVASFTSSCQGLTCSFDASGSGDLDGGGIVSHDWSFGDGATRSVTGSTTTYAYAAAGTFDVTLTVTDDEGATDTLTRQVVVTEVAPPATTPAWRAGASSDASSSRPSVTVPASVRSSDSLVLVATTNRAATFSPPAGWTVAGTVSDGTDMRSWVLTRTAAATTAGTVVSLSLDATSKTSLVLLAYSGAGTPSAVGRAGDRHDERPQRTGCARGAVRVPRGALLRRQDQHRTCLDAARGTHAPGEHRGHRRWAPGLCRRRPGRRPPGHCADARRHLRRLLQQGHHVDAGDPAGVSGTPVRS